MILVVAALGSVPFGYRVENRKLLIDEAEAATVRLIFERYRDLGSLVPLIRELRDRDVRTRVRTLSSGAVRGGVHLTKGPLAAMLVNRTYIGDLDHKETSYPGEHQGIVDRDLFDAVRAKLAENKNHTSALRVASNSLLMSKVFDDAGNRMTPTWSSKKGLRYRYYISRCLMDGHAQIAGSVPRVGAEEIETKVIAALKDRVANQPHPPAEESIDDKSLVLSALDRVVVARDYLTINLSEAIRTLDEPEALLIPWIRRRGRPKRAVIEPATSGNADNRPIRAETRAVVVRAIAQGRQWLQELVSGKVQDTEAIAKREDRSKRSVHMTMSLAFLAPDIVEAAVSGRLPRGIGIMRLIDLPPDWATQRKLLGLAPSA